MTESASEGPYQYHVRRLTSENAQLRDELQRERERHRRSEKALRAHLNEGFSPKIEALRRERDRLRAELARAMAEVRELKGKPPKHIAIDPAVRGLRVPRMDSEATAILLKRVKRNLRHVEVLLGQARQALTEARQDPQAQLSASEMAEIIEMIELRREDLLELVRLMQSSPASSTHRGVRSYRPVPSDRGVL